MKRQWGCAEAGTNRVLSNVGITNNIISSCLAQWVIFVFACSLTSLTSRTAMGSQKGQFRELAHEWCKIHHLQWQLLIIKAATARTAAEYEQKRNHNFLFGQSTTTETTPRSTDGNKTPTLGWWREHVTPRAQRCGIKCETWNCQVR